jgi:catechol 2,3-dioxygenase-like lactoylglutathione lyase family enzyme
MIGMSHIRTAAAAVALAAALLAGPAQAQIAPPNAAGVAMGHLRVQVPDVEASAAFWARLGGTRIVVDGAPAVKFPGVLILLSRGTPTGLSEGAVLNHIAFRLPSFAPLEAAGFTLERSANFPGVASVRSPEGERVEVFEDTAPNVGFTQAQGYHDATAERHNQPVPTPIALHHIHFYVPEGAVAAAQAWYVRLFGGTPGKRDVYDAVDLPGVNLNISSRPGVMAPTKGRLIDRLGFEVSNLDAFCKRAPGLGITLDAPCARDAAGVVRARLIDPWGTSIELTDGLRRY